MLGLSVASGPDLLRLLALPYFGYVAWRDIRTRRIPNRLWLPLAGLAAVLLIWELLALGGASSLERQQFLLRVAISVGFVVPLAYAFWWIGGFGGADAKAFFVIAVLFPTFPTYDVSGLGLEIVETVPVVETAIGVFSLTILANAVLAGAAYPLGLAVKNAATGYRSPGMFVATPIAWNQATERYGSLLEFPNRRLRDDLSPSGLRAYFSWQRLDLDALRMYLAWRGSSLGELRAAPARYRDPNSLPAEPNPPGDGSIVADGGSGDAEGRTVPAAGDAEEYDDPWGAEAFLDSIDGSAYGTTPEQLREGLETLTSEEVVWISPGIPFLVPLFAGLALSFTYGDALFALLAAVGAA